jgi:hypothetical protein
VAHATREIVEELDRPSTAPGDATATEGSLVRGASCSCVRPATRSTAWLSIAGQLIDATRWQVEILGPSLLTSEVAQLVEERHPALVCIGSVAPAE